MVEAPLLRQINRAIPMGLDHCPLCVGLAILSVVRSGACAVMLWQWIMPQIQRPFAVGGAASSLRPAI